MDCANHNGVTATAYCQNCGKALCAACVRNAAGGQVLCEPCWTAWQSFQQPFAAPHPGAPNPAAAAVLGLIPGVGAMYNGQFFKGLIHVVIFAVLVSMAGHYPIFGLFIAAWVLYQSFEAYHTAKALRDGQPLPDPLGLNGLGSWLNLGGRTHYPGHPGPGPHPGSGPAPPGQPGPDPAPGSYQPYAGPHQPPYQSPYQQPPYQDPGVPPASGFTPPGFVPPPPAVPPVCWQRKEPVAAIVLIGLGLLFLLGQMNLFSGRLLDFTWPVLLIGLGVWLIVSRLQEPGSNSHGDSQGGPK
jgi:TM2 domain-containing membrane protein YozV